MRLTGEAKLIGTLGIVSAVAVAFAVLLISRPTVSLARTDLLKSETSTIGKVDADIFLVEFSDFQCPACKAYQPYVDQIVEKYKDRIVFGYRHFPLSQHKSAFMAAEAVEAAGDQGKFWEMYEYLFKNQDKISEDFIKSSGKEIGLDDKSFKTALSSRKYENKVLKDISDGIRFGVNSTPTFFLNGRKLTLRSFADLEKIVLEEINK